MLESSRAASPVAPASISLWTVNSKGGTIKLRVGIEVMYVVGSSSGYGSLKGLDGKACDERSCMSDKIDTTLDSRFSMAVVCGGTEEEKGVSQMVLFLGTDNKLSGCANINKYSIVPHRGVVVRELPRVNAGSNFMVVRGHNPLVIQQEVI